MVERHADPVDEFEHRLCGKQASRHRQQLDEVRERGDRRGHLRSLVGGLSGRGEVSPGQLELRLDGEHHPQELRSSEPASQWYQLVRQRSSLVETSAASGHADDGRTRVDQSGNGVGGALGSECLPGQRFGVFVPAQPGQARRLVRRHEPLEVGGAQGSHDLSAPLAELHRFAVSMEDRQARRQVGPDAPDGLGVSGPLRQLQGLVEPLQALRIAHEAQAHPDVVQELGPVAVQAQALGELDAAARRSQAGVGPGQEHLRRRRPQVGLHELRGGAERLEHLDGPGQGLDGPLPVPADPVRATERRESPACLAVVPQRPPSRLRLDQRRASPSDVTTHQPRPPQLVQQRQTALLVALAPDGERRLVSVLGLDEPHPRGGEVPRSKPVRPRLLRDVGLGVVLCQRLQEGRVVAGLRLQGLGHPPVQLAALPQQQGLVHDFLDERVLERPLVGAL